MSSDGQRRTFSFLLFLADSMAGKSSGQKQSNLVLAGLYWRCDQWPAPEEDPLLTPACFSILALELLPWNAIDQRLLAWPFLPPPANGTESILIHLAKVNGTRGYGRLLIMFLMVTPSIGREMHGQRGSRQWPVRNIHQGRPAETTDAASFIRCVRCEGMAYKSGPPPAGIGRSIKSCLR